MLKGDVKMSGRTINQRGFTLIELLVVIAIIAILAAILFPVFAKAREKAKQTTCISNLKQMGTAISAYCQDFDEYMPLSFPEGWNNTADYANCWISEIHPYIANCAWDGGGPNTSKILFCPADTSQIFVYNKLNKTNYMYQARMGNMNETNAGNTTYSPRTLAKCQSPTQDAIMVDGNCKTVGTVVFDIATAADAKTHLPARHFGGLNILYADTHVAWFNISSASKAQVNTTFMWNNGGGDWSDWPW